MNQQVYIIINPYSRQGRGWKRWNSIKQDVLKMLPGAKEIITTKKEDIGSFLKTLVPANKIILISAGGDGSIHHLVNFIMRSGTAIQTSIVLGAIGLGSSNDFLKPFASTIKDISFRADINSPILHRDLGKATYVDHRNTIRETYFMINASFGVTAEGNWNFNNPGPVLKWLKKNNTSSAISYTAISTILSYKNKNCVISYNSKEEKVNISNINILKIPFVSGSLHYQQPVLPDDGRLALNICIDMNKRELLKTLFALEKGRFPVGEKRISAWVTDFSLRSDSPVVFECDGETDKILKADITVMPKAIRVLSR